MVNTGFLTSGFWKEGEGKLPAKILVVEDEKLIAEMIQFNLEKEGYSVFLAFDGKEALNKAFQLNPDLILLDIMLPKIDGFAVCQQLRQSLTTPIIMLTAKETEKDKVKGLELGADDYVTKPFSPRELLARVKANLRRVQVFDSEPDQERTMLDFGTIKIDMDKYEAIKRDETVELTVREFELLKYLALNAGRVFTREELLKEVWGYDYYGDMRTVDVTVRRLREKIEDNPSEPEFVITKRGVGYYFRRP